MVEINDDIRSKAEEAYKNKQWEEFRNELVSMIRELNPDANNNQIRKKVRQLRAEIAGMTVEGEEAGTEEQVGKEKTFNNVLRKSFTYNGKPLNFSNLVEGDFSVGKVQVRKQAPQNLEDTLRELEAYSKELGEETLIHNVEELTEFYVKVKLGQDRPPSKKKVRINMDWAEEVGDLPLGNWSTRKKIYDYWGKIHGKYPALIEAVDNFVEEVSDLHKGQFDEGGFQEMYDEFFKKAGEFASWYREGIPNYVVKLPTIKMTTPDAFTNAVKIMDKFLDLQGVVSPKKEGEGVIPTYDDEGEEEEAVDYGEGETKVRETGSLADLTGKKKTKQLRGALKEYDVDPIFWYKYHKDYENLNIPKSQLNKIKLIIEKGLPHLYFESEEYLDNFERWFKKFNETIDDMKVGQKSFFLPLSNFISDDIKELEIESEIINDRTFDFLEHIAELAETQKTSFSIYQSKIKGEMEEGGLPFKEWAGRKGTERDFPKELDKSWNELLKAINEYYLLPLQGKRYVQAKEKPSWAKGHASLVLSIKNLKENPLGALLDKMVNETIHTIRPKHIENLTKFIEMARSTGAKSFTKDIFSQGRKAIKSLNAIFGKEWNEKSKENIGYIIFDMGKKLGVENIKEFGADRYWSNIFSLYKNYKKNRNSTDYPLDHLRHALNTPEFTAWIGISEGRDRSLKGAYPHTDPDLVKALIKLDAVFDTFHKMDNINQALLNAHDSIRKMENKPVLHSHLSLDYIEHMDLVINKLHREQRMDLTATEINKIVKAISSYESIANNFGINEEVVYTVKAMFR